MCVAPPIVWFDRISGDPYTYPSTRQEKSLPKVDGTTFVGVSVCSLAFRPLRFESTCQVVIFTVPGEELAVTVAVVLAVKLPSVAVIKVVPEVTPVARPLELMVATEVSDEVHVADELTFLVLPSL